MVCIIGIDPGISGAIAIRSKSGWWEVYDMPALEDRPGKRRVSPSGLRDVILSALAADPRTLTLHAFVELVHAMPGQGVTSMFGFGRTLGVIEGVLAGIHIPVTHVTSKAWKQSLSVPAAKDGARARACELLPGMADMMQRKKDDGRAEALLIGLYGARVLGA
jgi:crossover junction endodeoxyribonuclease RuvC